MSFLPGHYRALFEKKAQNSRIYVDAEELLLEMSNYFGWAETTSLLEEELFHYQGGVSSGHKAKMRAFTKEGMCVYLGITTKTLERLRTSSDEFRDAIEFAEDAIRAQKFEGAAAGLLNANLITRDLGLAEKSEVSGSTTGGPPISFMVTPIAAGTFLQPAE